DVTAARRLGRGADAGQDLGVGDGRGGEAADGSRGGERLEEVHRHHRPLNTGGRFSRSAASASRWSSLWKVSSSSAVEVSKATLSASVKYSLLTASRCRPRGRAGVGRRARGSRGPPS